MKDSAGMDFPAGERGAVSIKAILMLLIAAIAAFAVIKVAPVYLEERSITYEIDDLANKIAVRNSKPEDVKKEIERLRKEYGLPEGSISYATAQDSSTISVSYNRNIDFFVTSYDWRVDHKVSGKAL
jgi:hypothetical protein